MVDELPSTENPEDALEQKRISWKVVNRTRTVWLVLVLCLNIGTDPPDSNKIRPCACLECGIDPMNIDMEEPIKVGSIGRVQDVYM